MLAWEPVVEARALHARGWTISAIARHLQINRRTVRRYLSGEVEVGKRRPAGPDEFERFAGYARQRLFDDPRLRRRAATAARVALGRGEPCHTAPEPSCARRVRHFCRWEPELKMIRLRFSKVMDPEDYARFPDFDADPRQRRWNLWAYIDGRDGAKAVRLALAHNATGVDTFVIANADTVMSRRSADLAAEFYPGVPVTRELDEHETMLSIEKARRVLGY
jgi:hypothetical protein